MTDISIKNATKQHGHHSNVILLDFVRSTKVYHNYKQMCPYVLYLCLLFKEL